MWVDREFRVVDGFELVNHYAGAPNYELLRTEVVVRAGDVEWSAVGRAAGLPAARHRQPNEPGARKRPCGS